MRQVTIRLQTKNSKKCMFKLSQPTTLPPIFPIPYHNFRNLNSVVRSPLPNFSPPRVFSSQKLAPSIATPTSEKNHKIPARESNRPLTRLRHPRPRPSLSQTLVSRICPWKGASTDWKMGKADKIERRAGAGNQLALFIGKIGATARAPA